MGTFESRNHHHGRVSAATATVRLQRHTIIVDNCCLCCGVRLTRLLAAGAVVRAETGALDSTRLRRLPGCHRSLEISFAFAFDEHRRTVAYSHTHASAKHITPLAAAAAATSRSLPPPPPPRRGTQDACVSAYGASAAGNTDAPTLGRKQEGAEQTHHPLLRATHTARAPHAHMRAVARKHPQTPHTDTHKHKHRRKCTQRTLHTHPQSTITHTQLPVTSRRPGG